MILLDFYQTAIAAATTEKGELLDESSMRQKVCNMIRSKNFEHRKRYGELIICSDSGSYWRRDIFPEYKLNRAELKDKSGLDWKQINQFIDTIRSEARQYFPYRFVQVDRCEADDVIATIAQCVPGPHIIVSSDGDFKQLHTIPGLVQYSPRMREYVKCDDPMRFLHEKVMGGDRKDGVPNVKSDNMTFIEHRRQKPISKKDISRTFMDAVKLDAFLKEHRCELNYRRNMDVLSLRRIPEEYKDAILATLNTASKETRYNFMKYLIRHDLPVLATCIEEF